METIGDYVERRWAEAQETAAACKVGDCLYTLASCHRYPTGKMGERICRHDHTCLGYEGFRHVEHGRAIMRYRRCARAREWDRRDGERMAGTEKTWQGGALPKLPPPSVDAPADPVHAAAAFDLIGKIMAGKLKGAARVEAFRAMADTFPGHGWDEAVAAAESHQGM